MANTLVGLFDDRDVAQNAVQDLVSAGFSRDRISVVANDGSGSVQTSAVDVDGNLAAEGASAGVSSGAVVGGVAGLLIGAGFTVLPIAGLLLAGPIAGLLAGAATGAATGGVVGGLIGLGIPEENADDYAEGVRRGGILVTIQAEASEESRARDILDRDGAVDIDVRSASWRESGYKGFDAKAKPYSSAEIASERARYATPINSDWNDTANAPAPSVDATYASGSTYGTDFATGNHGDAVYRTHFVQNYPNGDYEEYAPAYSYGRLLADSGTGDWDANESTYRAHWENSNPGTWDKFKASVRHAYDSATGQKAGVGENRANLY